MAIFLYRSNIGTLIFLSHNTGHLGLCAGGL